METAAGPLQELSGWSTLHQRMLPGDCVRVRVYCRNWVGQMAKGPGGEVGCHIFLAASTPYQMPVSQHASQSISARILKVNKVNHEAYFGTYYEV